GGPRHDSANVRRLLSLSLRSRRVSAAGRGRAQGRSALRAGLQKRTPPNLNDEAPWDVCTMKARVDRRGVLAGIAVLLGDARPRAGSGSFRLATLRSRAPMA